MALLAHLHRWGLASSSSTLYRWLHRRYGAVSPNQPGEVKEKTVVDMTLYPHPTARHLKVQPRAQRRAAHGDQVDIGVIKARVPVTKNLSFLRHIRKEVEDVTHQTLFFFSTQSLFENFSCNKRIPSPRRISIVVNDFLFFEDNIDRVEDIPRIEHAACNTLYKSNCVPATYEFFSVRLPMVYPVGKPPNTIEL